MALSIWKSDPLDYDDLRGKSDLGIRLKMESNLNL